MLFALLFFLTGIVLIVHCNFFTNAHNSTVGKPLEEAKKYLGRDSVPKAADMQISNQFVKLLGYICFCISIFFVISSIL